MSHKLIALSDKKSYAKVSVEDYSLLSKFNWHITGNGYCFINLPRNGSQKRKTRMMHRFILDAEKGTEIDHINGDKLDNRRENIRFVTRNQNQQKVHQANSTGFRGVRLERKKWRSRIYFDKKEINLGLFVTPEEAAKAYDIKAKELYGEHALHNFSE